MYIYISKMLIGSVKIDYLKLAEPSGQGKRSIDDDYTPTVRSEFVIPPTQKLSRDARKPVFGVSDQVRHKPTCTISEKG